MTEDNPIGTAWRWVRTAPLPVVLALLLALGSYTLSIADDAKTAKAKAESAEEKVKDIKDQLKDANHKLDKLIEAVSALKQQAEDNAKKKP